MLFKELIFLNRFSMDKEIKSGRLWRVMPVLLITGLIVLFNAAAAFIEDAADNGQRKNLETALRRSIMQCYAIEGTYPPSLGYIEENYGFFYDTDKFYIDYAAIGSNIMPDVTILQKSR